MQEIHVIGDVNSRGGQSQLFHIISFSVLFLVAKRCSVKLPTSYVAVHVRAHSYLCAEARETLHAQRKENRIDSLLTLQNAA